MALDERVARIEGRMTEQSQTLNFFRDAMNRIEARFTGIDGRLVAVDARLEQIDARFDRLEDRMSRQFCWLVGLQVTTLVGVIGGLFGIVSMLAGH